MKIINLSFPLIAWIMLGMSRPAEAFSATSPERMKGSPTAASKKKLNFHQVLQKVGKSVFRPGGSAATNVMHGWAQVTPNDKVLEMSAGLGTGGMAFAKQHGCKVVLSDQDESRLVLARKLAQQRGVDDLTEVLQLDMRKIAESLKEDEHFAAVVVEASLSHQPNVMKEKILKDLQSHTDQLLFHEIGLFDATEEKADEVRKMVGSALAIGFYPLTVDAWEDLLDRNGYKITHLETGPIRVLNPKNMLQDEGPSGFAKIAWNLATHPDLRERVKETRSMVQAHSDSLGYIILRAVKK